MLVPRAGPARRPPPTAAAFLVMPMVVSSSVSPVVVAPVVVAPPRNCAAADTRVVRRSARRNVRRLRRSRYHRGRRSRCGRRDGRRAPATSQLTQQSRLDALHNLWVRAHWRRCGRNRRRLPPTPAAAPARPF